MAIKVKFFGVLRNVVGEDEMEMPFFEEIEAFMAHLIELYPDIDKHSYVIAVNHEVVNENENLNDGDELALMPPFAGG